MIPMLPDSSLTIIAAAAQSGGISASVVAGVITSVIMVGGTLGVQALVNRNAEKGRQATQAVELKRVDNEERVTNFGQLTEMVRVLGEQVSTLRADVNREQEGREEAENELRETRRLAEEAGRTSRNRERSLLRRIHALEAEIVELRTGKRPRNGHALTDVEVAAELDDTDPLDSDHVDLG